MREGTRWMGYDRRFGLRERGWSGDIVRVGSAILRKSCECHENRGRDGAPGERALVTAPRGHRTYRGRVPFTASRHRDPERKAAFLSFLTTANANHMNSASPAIPVSAINCK